MTSSINKTTSCSGAPRSKRSDCNSSTDSSKTAAGTSREQLSAESSEARNAIPSEPLAKALTAPALLRRQMLENVNAAPWSCFDLAQFCDIAHETNGLCTKSKASQFPVEAGEVLWPIFSMANEYQDITSSLAMAFDRVWERYYHAGRVTVSQSIARAELAKRLVELSREGVRDEHSLTKAGLSHLRQLPRRASLCRPFT